MNKHINREMTGLLLESIEKYMAESPVIMFLKDDELRYVAVSAPMVAMMGKESASDMLGRTDAEILEDQDLARRYMTDDAKVLSTGQDLVGYIEPIQGENGEPRYASTSKYILRDNTGKAIGILGVCYDVTAQMRAHQQYEQVLKYFFSLPDETMVAISIDVDSWRIMAQQTQESCKRVVPVFSSMDHLRETLLYSIQDEHCEAYQMYQQLSPDFLTDMFAQGKHEIVLEHQSLLSNGSDVWVRDRWKFFVDPQNGHLIVMLLLDDIRAYKQAEMELVQAAQTDGLTGLLNRATIKDKAQSYLAEDGARGTHAVFMIDLDDFKKVNDTFGHQAGDMLLCAVAEGIKDCFRNMDIVGRMGGDEFFVLAKNISSQKIARGRAKMLLDVLRNVYASQTTAIGSVSIGVSMYPTDGKTLDELYEKADAALYQAKIAGKNRVSFTSSGVPEWNVQAMDKRYEAYNSQVVDHSQSVCYISDLETHELLHLTKAAMEIHGLTSQEEYRGKTCYQVIMGLDKPCPFCNNSKLVEGVNYRWERYNDNLHMWFDRTSSIIHLDGRPCHLEIARDITDRKKELSVLTGKLTMEDILLRCIHTLTCEKDTSIAFNKFLEAVGGFYQADRAYIYEFDLLNGWYSNTFEWCAEGVSAEMEHLQRLPIDSVQRWIDKFKANGEFSITSLGSEVDYDSEEYRILSMQGIRSLLAAPLWEDGVIVGLIGVDDPIQNQGNLTLLCSVSEFVQAELERRKLIEELENRSAVWRNIQ